MKFNTKLTDLYNSVIIFSSFHLNFLRLIKQNEYCFGARWNLNYGVTRGLAEKNLTGHVLALKYQSSEIIPAVTLWDL